MDDDRRRRRFIDERILLVSNNDPSTTEILLRGIETEDQIRALFWGMQQNTRVRKLDLLNTPRELRRAVCQQLLPLLLRENSSIEVLGFPVEMKNAEFEFAAEILCNSNSNSNTAVTTLSLDRCDIRGTEGGEIIARLIQNNNHRITTINLYRNLNLGPAGALCIAAALGDENCALKTLDLGWCGIGDQGVDALCTTLQVNTLLETFRFYCYNRITDEGYRAMARSLPRMSGLKEICFRWEQRQVSAAVLQQVMDGLRQNQSLQRIDAVDFYNCLSEEQRRKWKTCCAFVGARNKMNSHLDEVCSDQTRDVAREGVAPVPIPIGPLLVWCCRQGNSEVRASLIHPLLCSRVDEIAKFAEARLNLRHSKRRRRKVDYSQM